MNQLMQAIRTQYMAGVLMTRPYILAQCESCCMKIPRESLEDMELNSLEAHRAAASLLVSHLRDQYKRDYPDRPTNPWEKGFATGALPDGSYAHVLSDLFLIDESVCS